MYLNEIEIYGISIPICLVFVSLLINSYYAQSSEDFNKYTDDDLGFTIDHPSKWKPEGYFDYGVDIRMRENESDDQLSIVPDIGFFGSMFSIYVEEPKTDLDTETMTLKNASLEERVQEELDKISSYSHKETLIGQNLVIIEETLIRQNPVTIGSYDGWKIEHRDTVKPVFGDTKVSADRYVFEIYTLANGKFYVLKYIEDPINVPETLPLANKMVESFYINR